MNGDENFITAILTQAVEDAQYTGTRKRYITHKVKAIDWILNKKNKHHWAFIDYCTMIGLHPAKIQNKVSGYLNPKLTTIQKSIMKGI